MKKFIIIGFIVALATAGALLLQPFNPQPFHHPSDIQIQQSLAGKWAVSWGDPAHSTNIVSADGRYEGRITDPVSGGIIELEGTLRVENGFLIDTMTKNSFPNAHVPLISRGRIIRASRSEIVVDFTGGLGHKVYYKKVGT